MKIVINNNGERIPATLEIVDGVMIVSSKEEKVDITQFKDGDIITCGWESEFSTCSWVCVLNGTIEKYKDDYFFEEYCGTYLVDGDSKEQTWIDSYSDSATWVRYATEEEKQKLFDALAKDGKTWDSEKKAVVDLEWRPYMGEIYYSPLFYHCDYLFKSYDYTWRDLFYDNYFYNKGWCFKTKEECEAFCKRLNEAIEGVKP